MTNTLMALLLEDEPLISMDVEQILRAESFDVTTVMSCREADGWLDKNRPDVVIVDIELRDGPCTDVVARLVDASIPFVVHSGAQRSAYAATSFARGAWVGKPAAAEEMVDALKASIDDRRCGLDRRDKITNADLLNSRSA